MLIPRDIAGNAEEEEIYRRGLNSFEINTKGGLSSLTSGFWGTFLKLANQQYVADQITVCMEGNTVEQASSEQCWV